MENPQAAAATKMSATKKKENTIGQRIRDLRKDLKYTQEDLAKRIAAHREEGCSRAAVGQWEIGTTSPAYDMVQIIARVLKVDPSYIAFGSHGPAAKNEDQTPVNELRFGDTLKDARTERTWSLPIDVLRGVTEGEVEDLFLLEVRSNVLRPDYIPGDRVLVDRADKKPTGGIFAYWDGISVSLGHMSVVPSAKGPLVKISGEGVDLDPLPLDSVEILGKVKGRFSIG